MSSSLPLARSYLFVPGDRPARFAKALASGADAIVLDLEDAVAPAAKNAARDAVGAFLAGSTGDDRARCVVRINAESTPWFEGDLELVEAAAHAVMYPKAEQVQTLQRLRARRASLTLLPLIESARGVLAAEALASAAGVQRLVFGTLDFALDMDLGGELASTIGLDHAAARLSLASRAAGIASPVAGVTTALDSPEALAADLSRARAHGFGAKLCIHPKQVPLVHVLLAPSAQDVAWARRVLQTAGGAEGGAVQLDGTMVDQPVIERARRIVQRVAI